MTNKEKESLVAEWLGWKELQIDTFGSVSLLFGFNSEGCHGEVPHFTEDLYAIRAAEQYLTPKQKESRNIHLWRITGRHNRRWQLPTNAELSLMIESTAVDRTDALLKAINKWKP